MKNKKLLVLLLLPMMFSCTKSTRSSAINSKLSEGVSSVSEVKSETKENSSGNSNVAPSLIQTSGSSVLSTVKSEGSFASIYTSIMRPNITQNGLEIKQAAGTLENAYVEWKNVENANKYVVLYKSVDETVYKEVSDYLIRDYGEYSRVDIPGLKSGKYEIKVTAYNDDGTPSNATSTVTLETLAHVREGIGFVGGSASGAYKNDGTLQDNCDVIYVTKKNAKNVTCTINGIEYKGIQAIIESKEKTGSTKPMCIRVIGRIDKADLDFCGSSAEGLQIKGKTKPQMMNLTLEGIGEDAYFYGFGILIRNSKNVEIRNMGFIEAMDDCVSIDTANENLWVHNNDFYYGHNQGGDKAKGDGSLDTKGSTKITHSFNHFWDSGKCNLQGMSEEKEENSITYHHNWFDHSDSRHPRVRTAQVHVYNNYYDGNAKYGVGATKGCSVFVESNFFRNCLNPMLTAKQGSDMKYDPDGKGTFSSDPGGMIKSYNNHIEGGRTPVTYTVDPVEFDCVEVDSRYDTVPSTIVCKVGGTSYNNFDTSASMYTYSVETPENAKATTMAFAGRVNGGDLKFEFAAEDDSSYELNPKIVQALFNYQTKIVSVQGDTVKPIGGGDGGETSSSSMVSSSTQESSSMSSSPVITTSSSQQNSSLLSITPVGDEIIHNFTTNGKDSSFFTISGNLAKDKGTVEYEGLTLTQCLKMETATNISFTLDKKMTLTLVFNPTFAKGVKIDGVKKTVSNGVISIELEAGEHTLTKGDTANLYYISLK